MKQKQLDVAKILQKVQSWE